MTTEYSLCYEHGLGKVVVWVHVSDSLFTLIPWSKRHQSSWKSLEGTLRPWPFPASLKGRIVWTLLLSVQGDLRSPRLNRELCSNLRWGQCLSCQSLGLFSGKFFICPLTAEILEDLLILLDPRKAELNCIMFLTEISLASLSKRLSLFTVGSPAWCCSRGLNILTIARVKEKTQVSR